MKVLELEVVGKPTLDGCGAVLNSNISETTFNLNFPEAGPLELLLSSPERSIVGVSHASASPNDWFFETKGGKRFRLLVEIAILHLSLTVDSPIEVINHNSLNWAESYGEDSF